MLDGFKSAIVSTGNILSLNNITKNPKNPTEDLVESLTTTLNEYKNGGPLKSSDSIIIRRKNDDTPLKLSSEDVSKCKIGLKLFLDSDEPSRIKEAIEKAFQTLNVDSANNLVVSYYSHCQQPKEEDTLGKIKSIWSILEGYVNSKKIHQIGIADIEENMFKEVYEWASVKPSIIQINLATCCVVPPTLQEFCTMHGIQLLTHSDPSCILPESSLEFLFGSSVKLNWVIRFLVHIKCRGVLITKGYLVSITKQHPSS
ncbi:glutamate--cysteine ligase regulatory subunit [Agrilus planipennis]|uniref:GCS light chain n=1 Tax=Agrilus planipennis TaxID=224129 RepID=A0A1W4WMQ0_AGRPL|nr:glutamate--cysteine ligase regulatory subunit [Agrilus planipennis]